MNIPRMNYYFRDLEKKVRDNEGEEKEYKYIVESDAYHIGKSVPGYKFLFDLDFLQAWRDSGMYREWELVQKGVRNGVHTIELFETDVVKLLEKREYEILDENGFYIGPSTLTNIVYSSRLNGVNGLNGEQVGSTMESDSYFTIGNFCFLRFFRTINL